MTTRFVRTLFALLGIALTRTATADEAPATQPTSPLAHVVQDIHGKDYDLARHRGQVVLIVNVASRCGFTKQYAGLEKLYRDHKDAGLVVIGFPANNFKGQEPGTDAEILQFCTGKYDVTFPMMSKISVKGDDIHPLYRQLTTQGPDKGDIGWNFTKFLVGRDGRVVARFASKVAPDAPELTKAVEEALSNAASQ